ncbi:MAG: mono/diheme cytochrome c family protein, partial [Saprospiraceae bacterium]
SFQEEPTTITENSSVWEVLMSFGEPAPNHLPDESIQGASAERGEQIIKGGVTSKPRGGKINTQSNHFVCTSCHNIEKETPNLLITDPEARLKYAGEKGIPFLQGTTLFGAVNRSSFYNDDYEKKYGALVLPTRNNLREAIQLCAVECSQGRRLKDWQLESVLRYLWTLELKISDLNLSENDLEQLNTWSTKATDVKNEEAINFIQSKYQKGSPAQFVTPPKDRKTGYGLTGNPENGQLIYELSCLHCHEKETYSSYNLTKTKATFKYLKKHFKRYSRYSVYQVARYGTSPLPGKRAYMPQYTKEKMSDQQLEDLRAYIEREAR